MNQSGRAFLKNTQILKKPKAATRPKIDAKWREQSAPTMPQVKQVVQRMISSQKESKFFDTINATGGVTTAGTVFSLTDIPQGQTDITRIGDSVQPTSLEFGYTNQCGDATNVMRWIIFRWKPFFLSTAPSTNSILQTASSTNSYHAPYTHDGRDQFEVLYDKSHNLVLNQFNQSTNTMGKLRLAKKSCQYVATSTTNVSNGLYVLVISDSAVMPNPSANYYFRVNYKDA